MDDEMEDGEAIPVFVCFEIDLDYEFEAVKFFDLGREESPEETAAAEKWFEDAPSYPPSPLVAKMFAGKDVQMDCGNSIETPLGSALTGISAIVDGKGWALQNLMRLDEQNVKHRSTCKNHCTKVSTLLKPTASQMAKQNRSCQTKTASRIQTQYEVKVGRGFGDSNEFTHQAVKRQKLEQGHHSKILCANQQTDLFHKGTNEKNVPHDLNTQLPRMKAAVPRELELQTTRRVVSIQTRHSRQDNTNKLSEASIFKARPLNRKILDGPTLPFRQRTTPQLPKFKEFNFKTHERALQHSSSSASSRFASDHADPVKFNVKSSKMGHHSSGLQLQNGIKPAEEAEEPGHRFRTQSFNRKMDLSKGDVGVIRRAKQKPTVPKEFNFSTTKRCQKAPLSELFNKLCLTPESQMTAPDHSTDLKFQLPCCHLDSKPNCGKGTKENLIGCGQNAEVIGTHH